MKFFLALLLDLFPKSFRERVGEDWMALALEVLAEARAQGRWTLARAWAGLLMDTAKAVPAAHAHQVWVMMAKTPEGSEVQVQANGTLALARKWGKPLEIKATQFLSEYWVFFFLGIQFAMALMFLGQDASIKKMALTSPVVLLLLVSIGWHKEIKAWWLRLNKPVMTPLLFLGAGFLTVMTITLMVLIHWMSPNLVKIFDDYTAWKKGMDFPEWDGNNNIVPHASFDSKGVLLAEKKEAWCLNALTRLDVVTSMLKSSGQEGRIIQAILIRGTQDQLAAHECVNDAQLVTMADDVAMAVKDNRAPSTTTAYPWRHMPVFNSLLSGDAIAWPATLLTSHKFCVLAGHQEWGPAVETTTVMDYCTVNYENRNTAYNATLQQPQGTGLMKAWSWFGIKTFGYISLDNARKAANDLHTITPEQAQAIREDLRKHKPLDDPEKP